MRNKIFSGLLWLSTAAVVIASVLIAVIMYQGSMTTMQHDLRQEAAFIKIGMEQDEKSYLQALQAEGNKVTRVTLIAPDGKVLYDNYVPAEKMLNHKDREEVQSALTDGVGLAERMSDTLSEKTFYYALRLENGDVLRVARTTDSVFATVAGSIPYMIAVVLLVAFVAMLLARRITDKMVLPLEQVDLEHPLENDTYDELAPFLTRISQQQKQVSEGLQQLRQKQNELTAITQSMNEGLILLNDRQNILSINDSAARLFGLQGNEVAGKNILTLERGQEVQELLQKVAAAGSGESLYQKDGRYYQLCGSSVGGKGSVLLIFDVTEKRAAETLRREFSANVSHELKTPLQSILGYAEIMKNGLVQEGDKQRFLEKIYSEAGHLIGLIDNIMKLSRLDEAAGDMKNLEMVELKKLAENTAQRLQAQAAGKNISVSVSGCEAEVEGVPAILGEVIYNLIDNGIKYNRDGGRVDVTVAVAPGEAVLTFKDTGCGIGSADKERVFERFYRVDKSHFKETGGTGLGLSIVKHGILFHQGRIELESELEQGTTIKIFLPRK
ncbi:cell wall metabolism sensor histidine kinase WalK [uncultured Phascolarctobacterium sp.]|uniref:sensor histidine kinase n=1 Tax=uncultured Phascolarctobacterium sp. TaxID=512296 RepID=UPI0025FB7D84|nr:ATP-binding protein [uncultured Phascolarctobacterium sp.]